MAERTHGSQYTEPSDEPWPLVNARPRTFFKAPLCPDLDELDADVAFLGVPFDQGTLGRPGARFGPNAIRDAPRAYAYSDPLGAQRDAEGIFYLDLGDELLRGMADCGDVTVVPSDVLKNFEKLTRAVEKIVDRRGVLHSHGSPIRRCRELPLVNHITSIGIRSARRKAYEESQRDSSLIISTARFRDLDPAGVADLVPRAENLYITLDIDLLNPSQAPGTGTPEVGGLFYQETRECLEALVGRSNLVGFDLVEVAPPYDSSEITSQIAARLIVDILAARFPSK